MPLLVTMYSDTVALRSLAPQEPRVYSQPKAGQACEGVWQVGHSWRDWCCVIHRKAHSVNQLRVWLSAWPHYSVRT